MKSVILKLLIVVAVLGLVLASLVGVAVIRGARSHWFAHKLDHLAQATYQGNGLQFSYYRDWRVEESAPPPPTITLGVREGVLVRVVQNHAPTINVEGPNGAVVTFALFDPSY